MVVPATLEGTIPPPLPPRLPSFEEASYERSRFLFVRARSRRAGVRLDGASVLPLGLNEVSKEVTGARRRTPAGSRSATDSHEHFARDTLKIGVYDAGRA